MAVSSAILSISASPKPAPFFSKFTASSVRLLRPVNLRVVLGVTYATASEPTTGKRAPRGIRTPRRVSPEMQAVVGAPEIPRTQALKRIWDYIKEHGLQLFAGVLGVTKLMLRKDPENKKIIVCDEKLKKIFGKDRVGFLEIAGLISPHFL